MDLEAGLRTAITECGWTHYKIAKEAGIAPGVISRFVSGERGLQLATAAKIATALGYELAKTVPPTAVPTERNKRDDK